MNPRPAKTYLLTLTKKSIVQAAIIAAATASETGIFINGSFCGFNASPTNVEWHSSASCSLILPPGTHTLGFCTQNGSFNVKGSVVVLPNE